METVELDLPEGKIRYGCLVCTSPRSHAKRLDTKLRAVAALLAAEEDRTRPRDEIRLTADDLGRPCLSVHTGSSPAVSFSWEGDRLWSALSFECSGLGIDAALQRDFSAPYPFARAFGEKEWERAASLLDFDEKWRAAMLWSVKEAAVKMIGCGFHSVDPRDVTIKTLGRCELGWRSDVAASIGSALKKVRVYSLKRDEGWISFAPQARA